MFYNDENEQRDFGGLSFDEFAALCTNEEKSHGEGYLRELYNAYLCNVNGCNND